MLWLILLFSYIWGLAVGLQFTTPPTAGAVGDYSLNSIYVIGGSLRIKWTLSTSDSSDHIRLTLSQSVVNDQFEYVNTGINASALFYDWTVATSKNIAVSNAFFFQVYYVGGVRPVATSHYFNITSNSVVSTATTASSTSSVHSSPSVISTTASLSSTSISTQAASPTTSTTPSFTSAASQTSSPPSGGMGTGAKTGLGVGIPVAVAIGLGVGWFIFGRRRTQQNTAVVTPPMEQYHDANNGYPNTYLQTPVPKLSPSMGRHELPSNETHT